VDYYLLRMDDKLITARRQTLTFEYGLDKHAVTYRNRHINVFADQKLHINLVLLSWRLISKLSHNKIVLLYLCDGIW